MSPLKQIIEVHKRKETMLPTKLAEIKQKLTAKIYSLRTADENALLDELEKIDRLLENTTVRKSANLSETRMTSGPSSRCSCCGK